MGGYNNKQVFFFFKHIPHVTLLESNKLSYLKIRQMGSDKTPTITTSVPTSNCCLFNQQQKLAKHNLITTRTLGKETFYSKRGNKMKKKKESSGRCQKWLCNRYLHCGTNRNSRFKQETHLSLREGNSSSQFLKYVQIQSKILLLRPGTNTRIQRKIMGSSSQPPNFGG